MAFILFMSLNGLFIRRYKSLDPRNLIKIKKKLPKNSCDRFLTATILEKCLGNLE